MKKNDSTLEQEAARYRFIKAKAMRETAWDRYEGAMFDIHIHDPKMLGLDAAIDAAISKKEAT